MANLGVMQAQVGLVIANQLTSDQITTLLNLADLEESEEWPLARLRAETQFTAFAALTAIPISISGTNLVTRTDSGTFPAITAQHRLVISGQPYAPVALTPQAAGLATVTLAVAWPGALGAATATLFQMFYSIAGWREVTGVRQQLDLRRKTHEWLNYQDPYRQQTGSPAYYWAPYGQDANDDAQFELWPIETVANLYTAQGIKAHVDMVNTTDLPLVPSSIIVAKAIVKAADALLALRGDNRWASMSQLWQPRYESQRQRVLTEQDEQYGMIHQVQDSRGAPGGAPGTSSPGLDQIGNRDWPWETY